MRGFSQKKALLPNGNPSGLGNLSGLNEFGEGGPALLKRLAPVTESLEDFLLTLICAIDASFFQELFKVVIGWPEITLRGQVTIESKVVCEGLEYLLKRK